MADAVFHALRATATPEELAALMEAVTREFGCRYYALIHHDDLRIQRGDRVDLKKYPGAITERLIRQGRFRRDPVIRLSPM